MGFWGKNFPDGGMWERGSASKCHRPEVGLWLSQLEEPEGRHLSLEGEWMMGMGPGFWTARGVTAEDPSWVFTACNATPFQAWRLASDQQAFIESLAVFERLQQGGVGGGGGTGSEKHKEV